jgi:hypothetical protein
MKVTNKNNNMNEKALNDIMKMLHPKNNSQCDFFDANITIEMTHDESIMLHETCVMFCLAQNMKHNIDYSDILKKTKHLNPFKTFDVVCEHQKIFLKLDDFDNDGGYYKTFMNYIKTIDKLINSCDATNKQLNDMNAPVCYAFSEHVKKFEYVDDIMKILSNDDIKNIHGHNCNISVDDHGRIQNMNSRDVITGYISHRYNTFSC